MVNRKNLSKYVSIIAAIALMVSLLSACTSTTPEQTTPSELAEESEGTENTDVVTFTLNAPNYNFTIAPGRDFYVLGTIEGEMPDDAILSVSVYRDSDSKLVRRVFTDEKAPKDKIYYDYPAIELIGTDNQLLVKDSLMPDLLYDGEDLSTFEEQWRKCYYDDNNFTATFNGGAYKIDVNPLDQDGNPYEDIQEGPHTVVVEATSSDGTLLGSTEFSISIATTPNKIMSRFSPSGHYENLFTFVEETGYTIYVDDFSGLFYDVPFLVNYPQEMQIWINQKWQFMNGLEYETGRVHFLMYNVAPSSTTWKVELAAIQKTQGIDNPERLVCYYYDTGDLNVGGTKGQFVPFEENTRLHLYRADYQTGESQDNYVNVSDLLTVESDFDFTDGVMAQAGEVISLYGVFKPIQVDEEDLVYHENLSEYSINNRINTVEYSFTAASVNYSETKEVGLTRNNSGSEVLSLLEFKHDFEIAESWDGQDITVTMQGYDSHGNLVEEAYQEFVLTVQTSEAEVAA